MGKVILLTLGKYAREINIATLIEAMESRGFLCALWNNLKE